MIRRYRSFGLALVAALAVGGCEIFSPSGSLEVTHIEVWLNIEPETIAPGEAFTANAQLIHAGIGRATLKVRGGCLGKLGVVTSDGDPAEFVIDPDPCWLPTSTLEIAAGDTVEHAWRLEATSPGGGEVPPGTYDLQLEMDVLLPRGHRVTGVSQPLIVE